MADTESTAGDESPSEIAPPPPSSLASMADSFLASTDTAIRSARSLRLNSFAHLHFLQEFAGCAKSHFVSYEHKFFETLKQGLNISRENPAATAGFGVAAAFVLLRRPRRFLFRHTLGRFQSEEGRFAKTEKNVKELGLSLDLVKNESRKLVERAALGERDMKYGHSELMKAGSRAQNLTRTVCKAEVQAADLMDALRETPGREAIKLRAEVASMSMHLRKQKAELDKRILKISDLGVPV